MDAEDASPLGRETRDIAWGEEGERVFSRCLLDSCGREHPFEVYPAGARENIKEALGQPGKSVTGLAEAMGVSRPTVYKRLKNPERITRVEASRIADYLGFCDAEEIATGLTWEEREELWENDPENYDSRAYEAEREEYGRVLTLYASLRVKENRRMVEHMLASLVIAESAGGESGPGDAVYEGCERLAICCPDDFECRQEASGLAEKLERGYRDLPRAF